MSNLITIDQLLESVDLDFEPRFVTKDKNGIININSKKPKCGICSWIGGGDIIYFERIKLAEFDGKDWKECIYEVPRKTTGKIEKLGNRISKTRIAGEDYEISHQPTTDEIVEKINSLVDAVNELKAKFALPTLKPDLTDEDLRKMMRDPKYWRDKDSATIQKVQNGFNKLYGDKN